MLDVVSGGLVNFPWALKSFYRPKKNYFVNVRSMAFLHMYMQFFFILVIKKLGLYSGPNPDRSLGPDLELMNVESR
jgi:hypothetical protein